MFFSHLDELRLTAGEQALADRLFTHVDRLAGLIGPRVLTQPRAYQAAVTYIERTLPAEGEKITHETYQLGGYDASNIILERRGTTRPDEIIVIGAHYDTVPETPGADDNASAVAMLLEVARLTQSFPSKRTIRFVAFPCEEPPHFHTDTMGSQQYARLCRQRRENIVGMLCLEMVGYYSTAPNSQKVPNEIPRLLRPFFPKRGNFLAAVANLRSLRLLWSFRRGFKKAAKFPLFTVALPEIIHAIRLSDNSSFWDQGFPALMITDTSFLRNPHYHHATDLPGTLDYPRMSRATLGVASATMHLAKGKFGFQHE